MLAHFIVVAKDGYIINIKEVSNIQISSHLDPSENTLVLGLKDQPTQPFNFQNDKR